MVLGMYGILPSSDLVKRLEDCQIIPDIGTLLRVISLVSYETNLSPTLISDFAQQASKRHPSATHVGLMATLLDRVPELPDELMPIIQNNFLRAYFSKPYGSDDIGDILIKTISIMALNRSVRRSVRRKSLSIPAENPTTSLDLIRIPLRAFFLKVLRDLSQHPSNHTILQNIIARLPFAKMIEVPNLLRRNAIVPSADLLEIFRVRLRNNTHLLETLPTEAVYSLHELIYPTQDTELMQQIDRVIIRDRQIYRKVIGSYVRPTSPKAKQEKQSPQVESTEEMQQDEVSE